MEMLFNLGLAVVALYSVCLAWYLAQYKLALGGIAKGVTFVACGTTIFAATVTLAVFAIWPPFLPL